MPAAPKKGPRLGGDAAHQKAMLGNMFASLDCRRRHRDHRDQGQVPEARRREAHHQSSQGWRAQPAPVIAFMRDVDMAHKLFNEIGPRYADRPGGYLRILKLGPARATEPQWLESSLFNQKRPSGAAFVLSILRLIRCDRWATPVARWPSVEM